MPDIFPDGISGLSDKTSWPIVAHNRYWYEKIHVLVHASLCIIVGLPILTMPSRLESVFYYCIYTLLICTEWRKL